MAFPKQKYEIKADVNGELPQTARFTWGLSAGSIVARPSARNIEALFSKKDNGINATIFLKVEGLQPGCPDLFSELFPVAALPIGEPVDRIPTADRFDMMARMDNFYTALNHNEPFQGVVVVSFNQKDSNAKKLKILEYLFDAIRFRKHDVKRLSFLFDHDKPYAELVFWLVHPDGDLPEGYDDYSLDNLIKGEDLMKDLSKALPKYNCKCPPKLK